LETDAEADLDRAIALAEAHRLSCYDALYLELAARCDATLASLDARLNAAAEAEGIETRTETS
jgi:predicted nucleic acid-binding protein